MNTRPVSTKLVRLARSLVLPWTIVNETRRETQAADHQGHRALLASLIGRRSNVYPQKETGNLHAARLSSKDAPPDRSHLRLHTRFPRTMLTHEETLSLSVPCANPTIPYGKSLRGHSEGKYVHRNNRVEPAANWRAKRPFDNCRNTPKPY